MDDLLDEIRVTAQRVGRFSQAVEESPSEENRALWRAALDDLRQAIRRARSHGYSGDTIQDAAWTAGSARFVRAPQGVATPGAEDTPPRSLAAD